MKPQIFLDSGAFIAMLNGRDRWHSQVAALFSQQAKPRWATSYLVFSESYSWFLHRYGEESARRFSEFTTSLTGLRLFEATHAHHERVLKILGRFRGSKLTYVDASSLVLIEAHKIPTVWSTDYHLSLTGANVLPSR